MVFGPCRYRICVIRVFSATKARKKLGWKPTLDLQQMIEEMIASDLEEARKDQHLQSGGFKTNGVNED